jgi:hypothetical protein
LLAKCSLGKKRTGIGHGELGLKYYLFPLLQYEDEVSLQVKIKRRGFSANVIGKVSFRQEGDGMGMGNQGLNTSINFKTPILYRKRQVKLYVKVSSGNLRRVSNAKEIRHWSRVHWTIESKG